MKTKTYLKGCEWCNATGQVFWDQQGYGSVTQMHKTCPVCGGSGTILVTETI